MVSVIFEDQLELPMDINSLAEFRAWAHSDRFPEMGRIDYIDGCIEVEKSPEEYYGHGAVKIEIVGALWQLLKQRPLGELYSDRARIGSAIAALSAEPDILFFSHETLDSDAVQFLPKAGDADRFIEVEGPPDMLGEIVSHSSVKKDTQRLPAAYFQAGVKEFWLVDARHETLVFQIHRRGSQRFECVERDADGFQASHVFGHRFRLDRSRNSRGRWAYTLQSEAIS